MGYKTVESVMKHSRAKGSARLLLMVLATHADEVTLECFPGRDLLCQESAMSNRNVIRALKELETLGELTLSRGNGRGNQTTYKLSIDTLKGDKLSSFEPIKGDKSVNKGCQIRQERVTELVVKGDKSGFAYKEEPSLTIMEPSENHHVLVAVAPVGSSPVLEVFTYWQTRLNHPRSDLTGKRKSAISARLNQGFTVDEIKQAIDGCASSPYHMGQNDQGTVYDDLTLICRDDGKLQMFISKVGNNGRTEISKNGDGSNRGSAQRTTEDYGIRDCEQF